MIALAAISCPAHAAGFFVGWYTARNAYRRRFGPIVAFVATKEDIARIEEWLSALEANLKLAEKAGMTLGY